MHGRKFGRTRNCWNTIQTRVFSQLFRILRYRYTYTNTCLHKSMDRRNTENILISNSCSSFSTSGFHRSSAFSFSYCRAILVQVRLYNKSEPWYREINFQFPLIKLIWLLGKLVVRIKMIISSEKIVPLSSCPLQRSELLIFDIYFLQIVLVSVLPAQHMSRVAQAVVVNLHS